MNALTTTSARAGVRVAVFALLVALGLFLVPVGSAHAAEGDVTWTVRTASNAMGADRTSYKYTVNPGSKVDDALVITNHGDEPLDLAVYAADGYTTDSGAFDLVVAGEKSVNIGAWVTSTAERVTVPAGETVEFPFTLTVPKDATPGDYAGGIVTSLGQAADADGISVDRRLGIRISLRVGGELNPSLTVDNVRVDWAGGLNPFSGGDATMSYSIHNTGNAVLSAQQTAAVSGPFGLFTADAGAVEAPPELLPGESWDVSIPVHGVAATVWLTANAMVTPVVIEASGSTTPLEPIAASANGWAVPWTLLILVLVVAALVVLFIWLQRRRRVREDARVEEAVALALGAKDAAAPSVET